MFDAGMMLFRGRSVAKKCGKVVRVELPRRASTTDADVNGRPSKSLLKQEEISVYCLSAVIDQRAG
jgi:hypothetical protein